MLPRIIGHDVFAAWKEAKPADYNTLIHERFEHQKRSFDGTEPLIVTPPPSLLGHFTEEATVTHASVPDNMPDISVSCRNDPLLTWGSACYCGT